VTGLDGKVVSQVVTGGYSTCAIANGSPYCWGDINDSNVPVAADISALGGKTITKLVAGNLFACVLADGSPYCWGTNGGRPILGNGSTGSSEAPVAVDVSGALAGKTITDLFAGNSQACVSVAGGGAYCWGDNSSAQIGNGTRVNALVPTAVSGLSGTVTVMAGGYDNMCAVANGSAYCWGKNSGSYYNMIGDGTLHDYGYDPVTYEQLPSNFNMTPTAVDTSGVLSGKVVTHIDMGDMHVCVIAGDAPYCWGEWESSEAGSDGYYFDTASPVAVGGSYAAGNKTVGLWTEGGSTIFSYFGN
jgi:alpha-tubulin suppressor-like RCC1 family protein